MNISSKQTFYAIFFCIMLSTTMLVAQTAYQPSGLIKKVITGSQIDLTSVTIKDNDGNILDISTSLPMMESGKYSIEYYVDEQDRVKEIVLRPQQISLKEELEKIHVKDQALRKLLGCIMNASDSNSSSDEKKYLISLMAQEDKKNQEQVTNIIDKNGWLGISEVGDMANITLFLVIQHASVEIQEKYFPLLKESAEKGESRLADMALMDDRIRMYRKKKQLYGSQTFSINGKSYVWPIEDAKNVDERRKSVQLPPLADYLKLMGLSYPQDELPAELFK